MKTIEYSISEADAVRHLIVCDTQFTWAGVTNLTMPQMMDLQVRGWVVEGDSNDEFQLTEAGEAVVARALEHGAPATLATVKHGGCVQLASEERERFEAWAYAQSYRGGNIMADRDSVHPDVYADPIAQLTWKSWQAALSAQPSPGGQDALAAELLAHAEGLERMAADDRETGLSIEQAIEDGEGYTPDEATDIAAGLQHDAERGEETAVLLRKAASALAARQPVGSTPEWFELVIRDVCELDPEDPDAAGTVCIRLLDLRLIMERHALPAQAVDLADFKALYRAYVRLLESGRDRIRDLGGACDPVDVMEANDVDLQAARRVIDSQAVGNG